MTADTGFSGRVAETALQPCRAEDLTLAQGYYIEVRENFSSGSLLRVGDMWLGRTEKPGCSLNRLKALMVVDGEGNDIDVRVQDHVDVTRAGKPRRIVSPRDGYEKFRWANWCGGALRGPLHVLIELPDDGGTINWEIVASKDADRNLITPPCIDSSQPSTFETSTTV